MLSGSLFCGDMLANHRAVRMTSVANTTLLMNLTPVFVIVIAYVFVRERQSFANGLGMTAGAFRVWLDQRALVDGGRRGMTETEAFMNLSWLYE